MAGRPRKPTALHLVDGTAQPCRMNTREPQFPVDVPAKPAHIAANAVASAEWDRMLPLLLATRVMSSAYRTAFEAYCSSYADFVAAEAEKGAEGFCRYYEKTTVDGSGQEHTELKPHPALAESRNARKELRQAATQLGITPATSAKVVTANGESKTGFGAFQARREAISAAGTAPTSH